MHRTQTHHFPVSLDLAIDADHEVRLIDLFVDSLPLADYGFNMIFVENSCPQGAELKKNGNWYEKKNIWHDQATMGL